jgi:hypothetical protein
LRHVTLAISAPIFLHRRIHEEGTTTTITKPYDQQKTLLSLQKKSTRAMRRTRPDFRSCLSATKRGDKDERHREREREGMWTFENYGKLWTDCLVRSFFAAKRAN